MSHVWETRHGLLLEQLEGWDIRRTRTAPLGGNHDRKRSGILGWSASLAGLRPDRRYSPSGPWSHETNATQAWLLPSRSTLVVGAIDMVWMTRVFPDHRHVGSLARMAAGG